MAYVGMLYNPREALQTCQRRKASTPHQVRYLAGFYALDDLGLALRAQAAQVGWDEAEVQIALSDGGGGLEDFFRKNFPRAVCILDFWHAKEYLVELAQTLQKGVLVKKGLMSGHVHGEGRDLVRESLACSFSQPGIASMIIGTINPQHLASNVATARSVLESLRWKNHS